MKTNFCLILLFVVAFSFLTGCGATESSLTLEKSLLYVSLDAIECPDSAFIREETGQFDLELFRILPDQTEKIIDHQTFYIDDTLEVPFRFAVQELTNEETFLGTISLGMKIQLYQTELGDFVVHLDLPVSQSLRWSDESLSLDLSVSSRNMLVKRSIYVAEEKRDTYSNPQNGMIYRIYEDKTVVFRSEDLNAVEAYLQKYYGLTLAEVNRIEF